MEAQGHIEGACDTSRVMWERCKEAVWPKWRCVCKEVVSHPLYLPPPSSCSPVPRLCISPTSIIPDIPTRLCIAQELVSRGVDLHEFCQPTEEGNDAVLPPSRTMSRLALNRAGEVRVTGLQRDRFITLCSWLQKKPELPSRCEGSHPDARAHCWV